MKRAWDKPVKATRWMIVGEEGLSCETFDRASDAKDWTYLTDRIVKVQIREVVKPKKRKAKVQ
jgi:hypothetical protein